MPFESDLDLTPYLRPPRVDVPTAVSLGIALMTAMPPGLPAHARGAAQRVRERTVELQKAWGQQLAAQGQPSPENARPADLRLDTAWGSLRMRLEAFAGLPAATHPTARRAAEISRQLFPDGLRFLALPFHAEWAESQRRLEMIDAALATEVDGLAGPLFLAEVRAAHEAYGQALNITRAATPSVDPATVADPHRALLRAVGSYGLKVVGLLDRDDPASIALVRGALRPLADIRAAAERRAATSAGAADPAAGTPPASPTTPVPDLPA